MHPAVTALVNSLSLGKREDENREIKERDPVGSLARVYEVARNALEYRADHLVRRAAIERILRRQVLFSHKAENITEELFQELTWAKYIRDEEDENEKKEKIKLALDNYLPIINKGEIDRDWLLGVISADLEEIINPNPDYQQFTKFAFHVLKKRVDLPNVKNPDLLLMVAIDKVYSQSDEARVAYHIYRLIAPQSQEQDQNRILKETYKYYQYANQSRWMTKLTAFVRKQDGPLVLIRDMYFSYPKEFHEAVAKEKEFKDMAQTVLGEQLNRLRGRMNTATIRSLIYVFLTKMLLVIILENPAERLLGVKATSLALIFNIVIPVVIMWLLSARIKLPNGEQQQIIINQSWKLINDFDAQIDPREMFKEKSKRSSLILSSLFYVFYAVLFMAIFSLIWSGLNKLGFSIVSKVIFLFFLSLVSFFAYRIRQFAIVYNYKPRKSERTSLVDMLMLPIVVMGGWLSKGVSKLNFLVFFFDFILESPFKIILRFLDSWFQFLSVKKEEAVE